jgi:hypothetical protein
MKIHGCKILLALSFSFLGNQGLAYDSEVGPFADGKTPPSVLSQCIHSQKEGDRGGGIYGLPGQSQSRSCKVEFDNNDPMLSILDVDGSTLVSRVRLDTRFIHDVYSADLNKDGRADFVIFSDGGGNGFAALGGPVYVALTDGDHGYVVWWTRSLGASPEDFISLDSGKSVQMVHAYSPGDTPTDESGKYHTYFVYNLFRFQGASYELANDLSGMFPKWVQYKNHPNHAEDSHLAVEAKRACDDNGHVVSWLKLFPRSAADDESDLRHELHYLGQSDSGFRETFPMFSRDPGLSIKLLLDDLDVCSDAPREKIQRYSDAVKQNHVIWCIRALQYLTGDMFYGTTNHKFSSRETKREAELKKGAPEGKYSFCVWDDGDFVAPKDVQEQVIHDWKNKYGGELTAKKISLPPPCVECWGKWMLNRS